MQLMDPIFSAKDITKVFLIFFFVKEIIQSYLDLRNKKHILENSAQVPEKFKEKITLEDHQKAAKYNVAKINTGQFFQFYDFLILLGWTLGGGLNWLDTWVAKFQYSGVISGLIFFTMFALINMVLSLPESLYSTFSLE
jgi:STE24 endopeptidase